jgi:hypothetical protein
MYTCRLISALAATVLAIGSAEAQQVKPYVMLLFDTSGSMLWDVCGSGGDNYQRYARINGDNSSECPGNQVSCGNCNTYGCGNGVADDARLYKVKKGAYNVVSAFGEVTFGLARFHQTPAAFTCDTPNTSRAGGWRGAYGNNNYACAATGGNDPVGQGDNQADVLVGLAASNPNQILAWMNNCDDYPAAGSCPANLAPSSSCSLCGDCGGGCDLELRGSGNTPLAGSLYDLRVNYYNGASGVIATDPKASCRPYKLIMLTDGQNTAPEIPCSRPSCSTRTRRSRSRCGSSASATAASSRTSTRSRTRAAATSTTRSSSTTR